MPRYYCDYCDTYLTHDSPSVRKQHNAGYKHKANVRSYYQQFEEQQTQSLIDQRIKEHLGQAATFQVGGPFNQHLLSLQGNVPRPRLPVLPTPMLAPGSQAPMSAPLIPGVRPPFMGAPGYPGAPGSASMPMQMSSLPRPPTLPPPTSGAPGTLAPNSSAPPQMYQTNPPQAAATTYDPSGASGATTASQGVFSYGQPSEGNH